MHILSTFYRLKLLLKRWLTNYLTRPFCGGPICDDRNFGGPKIWRNWTKTVTFRTSQKIRVFFIILFSDTKEIQNFLKIGKIMLKQNETYKSISSSSSILYGVRLDSFTFSFTLFSSVLPGVRFSDLIMEYCVYLSHHHITNFSRTKWIDEATIIGIS